MLITGGFIAPQAPQAAPAAATNPWALVSATALGATVQAIEAATGGKVLEIRWGMAADGTLVWQAVVAKGDTISRMTIGADGRAMVVAETDVPEWTAEWTLRADKTSIQRAKVPLADAVAMAARMTGGIPVDAGVAKPLTGTNAVLAYNIEVIVDGRPQRVVIDAVTGQKIADPQSLLDAWSPEEAFMKTLEKAA
jgi:uncharacterized membrane protein YkoI